MEDYDRLSMVNLYREKAQSCLLDADAAIASRRWNMAANRIYYALLNAVRALLICDQHPSHSHDGAKVLFGQHYVLTGEVSAEQGRLFSQMETLRERSDYNCMFEATEELINEKYEPSKDLICRIFEIIESRYSASN